MQLEFQEYYEILFEEMQKFLHRIMIVKLGTMNKCNLNEKLPEKLKVTVKSFANEALLQIELEEL